MPTEQIARHVRLAGTLEWSRYFLDKMQRELCKEIPSSISEILKLKHRVRIQDEAQSCFEEERNHMKDAERNNIGIISELQSEIEGLRNSLQSVEADKEELEEQVKLQMSEINRMEQQIEDFQEEKLRADAKNEESQRDIDQLTLQLTERENNHKIIIVMILCSACAVLMVALMLCGGYHYKSRSAASRKLEKALGNQRTMLLKANEPMPLMPSHADRLGVKEHPEVRDQFGMKEVFDVTAGEGKDLVRIARPLETAEAERKLSEELMNIQPIVTGLEPEGAQDTVTEAE